MRESEWRRRRACERLGGAERVRGVGGRGKRAGERERTGVEKESVKRAHKQRR